MNILMQKNKAARVLFLAGFLVLSGACVSPVSGQSPISGAIDRFLRQAQVVRTYGAGANTHLRVMRREEPALALPILRLRRQANLMKPTAKADATGVKAHCAKWVGIARVLLRFGIDVSSELEKKRPQASQADREVLEALDRALHIVLAKIEIKKFTGKGTYNGMFDALIPRAKKITRAFMFILSDRLEEALVRGFAAEGLAQICPRDMRKEVRVLVGEIYQERDETPFIKETAMVVLARLGDRKILNQTLAKHRAIIATELAKKSDAERSFPKLLLSYEKISVLLQRVGDVATASEVNTDYLRMIFSLCRFSTQNESARANIAGQCYDFSCQLSQLGKVEFGLHILEAGFSWGLTAFDWAKEDKELTNLRKDPRFSALIDKWQKGNAALGSVKYNDVIYLTKAGRTVDGSKGATSKPTSRPKSSK
ncbi:MAG: hypothetical protein ACI97A_004136 [Planctomycetota bacterium]|jgi:hypothetical protein